LGCWQQRGDENQAQDTGRPWALAVGPNEQKVDERRDRDAENGKQHCAKPDERSVAACGEDDRKRKRDLKKRDNAHADKVFQQRLQWGRARR